MTFRLREHAIQAVVLDIEGTTTPVAFVTGVLFPFARRALRPYLEAHLDAPHLHEPFRQLHDEWIQDIARGATPPPWPAAPDGDDDDGSGGGGSGARAHRIAAIVAYCEWLMDRDRKASGLKALQGLIWQRGYEEGGLRGDVYPDVPRAFVRWEAAGVAIAIFSSGSVLAQRLLFQTTPFGDLTRSIRAFFDTGVGPKGAPDSYRHIAAALRCPAERLLFISDAPAEVQAARAAGWAVLRCVRPGDDPSVAPAPEAATIHDFDEVE